MYKIVKGHDIETVKPTRSDMELEGLTKGGRGNSFRIQRESFKSRNMNSYSHAVTIRHNFFLFKKLIKVQKRENKV